MRYSSRLKGFILVALATSLWGTTSIVVRYLLSIGIGLFTIAFTLTSTGSLVLLIVSGKTRLHRIRVDLLPYGVIVIPLFRLLYALSVQVNGAGLTASLLYVAPLIIAIISPITIGEVPTLSDYLLTLTAVAGAYISSNPSLKLTSIQGFLIGIGLAAIYASTIIAVKYFYGKGYRVEEVLVQPTLSSIPVLAVMSLLDHNHGSPTIILVELRTMLAIVWGGCISIGLALILYMNGMKYIRALDASIIATLEPISAIILSLIVLGEKYSSLQFTGIMLILLLAILITLKSYYKRQVKE